MCIHIVYKFSNAKFESSVTTNASINIIFNIIKNSLYGKWHTKLINITKTSGHFILIKLQINSIKK